MYLYLAHISPEQLGTDNTKALQQLPLDLTLKKINNLDELAYKGIKNWKTLFIQVLKVLADKKPEKFNELPENKNFISSRGNPFFTEDQTKLRRPEKTEAGFYVEVNHSANVLLEKLKQVMEYLDVEPEKLNIYLREDRDAEETSFAG